MNKAFVKNQWFLIGILLMIPAGYFFNTVGELLFQFIPLLTFTAIFMTGLNLEIKRFRLTKPIWQILILSNLTTSFIAPLIAYTLGQLFLSPESDLFKGLIVLSLLPTSLVSHIVLCHIAGGNSALSTVNTVISNIVSLLTIPLFLSFFLAKTVELSFLSLMSHLFFIILLPIILSQLTQLTFPVIIKTHKKKFTFLAQCIVLTFIYIGFSVNKALLSNFASISHSLPITSQLSFIILLVVTIHFSLLGTAYLFGYWFKFALSEKISLLFSASQKTLPVGMSLMVTLFPNGKNASLILIFYHIFQLLFDSFLSQRLSLKTKTK